MGTVSNLTAFTAEERAKIAAHEAATREWQHAADGHSCPTCRARSWWRPNEFVFRCRACGHILSADTLAELDELPPAHLLGQS